MWWNRTLLLLFTLWYNLLSMRWCRLCKGQKTQEIKPTDEYLKINTKPPKGVWVEPTRRTHNMSGVEQWAISPCKDCKNRKLGCHGECKKYAEFKAQAKKNKDAYHKANHDILSYVG